jgi:hypothetical protein
MATRSGRVIASGVARAGEMTTRLNAPIVGMAATPTGRGYWLVAADGGIFSFGDARFHGSTGNLRLAQPVVGMAATPTGRGYSLIAADGGVFTFGNARFAGSAVGHTLARTVTSVATSSRSGLWVVTDTGRVVGLGTHTFGATARLAAFTD